MQTLNLTASQTAENLVKGVFAEHKKTRISGDPRDFVDCYFDHEDLHFHYRFVIVFIILERPR